MNNSFSIILATLTLSVMFMTQCMEEGSVKIGTFSHAKEGQKQLARYQIARLGNYVALGLYDGKEGKEACETLRLDFIDDIALNLSKDKTLLKSFYESMRRREIDIWDDVLYKRENSNKESSPLIQDSSSLISAWLDTTQQTLHLISIGDSIACLIGKNRLNIRYCEPQMNATSNTFPFIGGIHLKENFKPIKIDYKLHKHTCVNHYDYLVLATQGLYAVLNKINDHARDNDFKKIFFDALDLPDKVFEEQYPLPNNTATRFEEGSELSDPESDDDEDDLRWGLKAINHDGSMFCIAERLAQVALSRGWNNNISVIVQSLNNNSEKQTD